METKHAVMMAGGCLFGIAGLAVLLAAGVGMAWATAFFVAVMFACHAGGIGYLWSRWHGDETDKNDGASGN